MDTDDKKNRLHKRAHHIDKIDIAAIDPSSEVVKVEANIVNLSEGGLCVDTFLDVKPESLVVMNFKLPGGRTAVTASGRIKWADEDKDETGIEFNTLSESFREWLKDYVENK